VRVHVILSVAVWLFAAIVVVGVIGFGVLDAMDKVESIKTRAPWITKILERRSAMAALLMISIVLLVGDGYEFLTKEVPDVAPEHVAFSPPLAPSIAVSQSTFPKAAESLITPDGLLTNAGRTMLRKALLANGITKDDKLWFSVVSAEDVHELDLGHQLANIFVSANLGNPGVTEHGNAWIGTAFHGVVVRIYVDCQMAPFDMPIIKGIALRDAFRTVIPAQVQVWQNKDHIGSYQVVIGPK
jgi:hypothetical protein